MRTVFLLALLLATPAAAADTPAPILLKPAAVFDGTALHSGWQVLVEGDRIAAAGPNLTAPAGAAVIDLPGERCCPG